MKNLLLLFCFVLFFEIGGNDRDIFINAAQIYIMRREILCLKMLTFMDIWKHRKFIWIAFYPLQYKLFYVSKKERKKTHTKHLWVSDEKRGKKTQ